MSFSKWTNTRAALVMSPMWWAEATYCRVGQCWDGRANSRSPIAQTARSRASNGRMSRSHTFLGQRLDCIRHTQARPVCVRLRPPLRSTIGVTTASTIHSTIRSRTGSACSGRALPSSRSRSTWVSASARRCRRSDRRAIYDRGANLYQIGHIVHPAMLTMLRLASPWLWSRTEKDASTTATLRDLLGASPQTWRGHR